MPMPPYPIYCYTRECRNKATFKIAAQWSDGLRRELKTYSLCCEACLPDWFQRTRAKQPSCRLAPGETLEPAGIYRLQSGRRDVGLDRLIDLEQQLLN